MRDAPSILLLNLLFENEVMFGSRRKNGYSIFSPVFFHALADMLGLNKQAFDGMTIENSRLDLTRKGLEKTDISYVMSTAVFDSKMKLYDGRKSDMDALWGILQSEHDFMAKFPRLCELKKGGVKHRYFSEFLTRKSSEFETDTETMFGVRRSDIFGILESSDYCDGCICGSYVKVFDRSLHKMNKMERIFAFFAEEDGKTFLNFRQEILDEQRKNIDA